jgi:FHA domain-containing protein
MRTAVGAGPVSTTATVSPTLTDGKPLITGPSPGIAQNLSGGEAPIVSSGNGTSRQPLSPGSAGARLVAPADGIQFALFGNRLILGRASTNEGGIDIDLSGLRRGAERISRRHAEIIKQGNDYFVRDLGSVNGTYIAGRGRLGRDQLYKLKDRDELVLGGAKLEFRRS